MSARNERIKLTAWFISSAGVGLIFIGLLLPSLSSRVVDWTTGATMLDLFAGGLGCIGGALWYLGRLR
jgi:hypothetical protein